MSRALQFALGILAITISIALGAIIAYVWRSCVGAEMPLDPLTSPACAASSSSANTAWIGLLLWPLALAGAGLAAIRALDRHWGIITWAIVLVLALLVVAANPVIEYVLLNLTPQSWDEPPWTGAFTAATLLVAGAVLLGTAQRKALAPTEP